MFNFGVEDKEGELVITIDKFFIHIPKSLQYSKDDLWIDSRDDGFLIQNAEEASRKC